MRQRRIVAMGGGGFSMEPENPRLDEFVLSLARAPRPRVCFLPTASGDSIAYTRDFYRAFAAHDCRPTDLPLFERTVEDLETFVLAQDVIYVGGGNTANALAVWRVHGLDALLARAWEQGTVLAGLSAGMICWFEQATTDSFLMGTAAPLHDGLGLLPGSACPHYDGEPSRRPAYRGFVQDGTLPPGYAADDGAAVVFEGTDFVEAVSSRPSAAAYWLQPGDGQALERRLDVRRL